MLDKETIIKYNNDAEELSMQFLRDYWERRKKKFPINPFDMLNFLNAHFIFREFDGIEGLYLPKKTDTDCDLVVINSNRKITRQRYTAAHEICHIIKDAKDNQIVCHTNSGEYIEKFADSFAASLLMPRDELRKQIDERVGENNLLTLDDVLLISNYFGTSFESCFYRIRNTYPYDLKYKEKEQLQKYKSDRKRKEFGITETELYYDLFDSWNDISFGVADEFSKQVFKHKYVYNDARLEGVDASYEEVSEIVEDLYCNRTKSKYCNETHESYCNIAGHAALYDYVYKEYKSDKTDIYLLSTLNKILYSCVPNPEYGGNTRTTNTLVLGTKFETIDWKDIMPELEKLKRDVDLVINKYDSLSRQELIKKIAFIHHRITQIHPFPDGNGRTSRAFLNILLLHIGLLPIFVEIEGKSIYYSALEFADKGNLEYLEQYIMKELIRSHIELYSNKGV